MFAKFICFVLIVCFLWTSSPGLWACESCTIPQLGKRQGLLTESMDKKWFFKYMFEEQNWHEKDALEAHNLHHQGHHFHDKTIEQFHHWVIGKHMGEKWTVFTDVPYVKRYSLEVDSHAILGHKQVSEGLGDVHVFALYHAARDGSSTTSLAPGIKFPTGATEEKNTVGTLFEPELQPGSGSLDYVLGGVHTRHFARWQMTGNAAYVFKTEGSQDYRFGDVVSGSFLVEHPLDLFKDKFQIMAGLDMNLQYEQKHKSGGVKVTDSGGVTLLAGPAFTVSVKGQVLLFGYFHLPAFQDLGGVHQTLDHAWSLGTKVNW